MITWISRFVLTAVLLWGAAVHAAPQVPALSGRVVDNANILSPATEVQLTQQLAAHEASTSNQLVVLTVPDLQGYAIADFALDTARDWQLGQKDLNNGVLLLIARDERKIRIEVGYGLEGDLTDARSKRIIQKVIRPAFKQGDFDGGVIAGTNAIVGTIEGTYTPPADKSSGMDSPLLPLGIIGLFGLANLMQGRVKTQYVNALVGGGFGGTVVAIATQKWYLGVLAGLGFALFASRARTGGPHRDTQGYQDGSGYQGGRHSNGGFGGGGFGGGGGGFGGGGASGGW